jgi:hypothetical protein
MEVTAKKAEVIVGLTIELTPDDASNFSVMLNDYMRLMREHGNVKGGVYWPWVEQLERRVELARRPLTGVIATLLLLCVATIANAQSVTLTNADLGKRHDVVVAVTPAILQAMHEREYHAPIKTLPPVYSSTQSTPGALSWLDFPPERPARRLDGTLLTSPVTIYGDTHHHERRR